jgi:hypothetical protein
VGVRSGNRMTPRCDDGRMDPVAALREQIDGLLDVDLGVVDDDTLHGLVVSVHQEIARLTVAHAGLLSEWTTRGIFERDGSKSPAHRLARETHSSVTSCRQTVARAKAAVAMDDVRQAVTGSRLSLDHLDLFAAVSTPERRRLFERDQQLLVDQCARLSYAHGVRTVKYWASAADDELRSNEDGLLPKGAVSRLHVSRTLDDTVIIDGVLTAIDGAIVDHELDRLVEQLRLADQHAGTTRTPAARRAAALVEMATRSATMPAGGRPPQPLFTVLIGERTFDRVCELANGTVISPGHLVEHLDSSIIESVLFDGPSTVIAVSSRRTFTGALRRAVQVRDRHCTHRSGCDTPVDHCDVDHIVPASVGGPTSQFNGRLRCPAHNRIPALHDGDHTATRARTITRLDELRARIRWRTRHHFRDDEQDDGP